MAPEFASNYTVVDFGPITNIPTQYGGIIFKPGDPNTLLVSGQANTIYAAIYEVPVTRDQDGHITGLVVTPLEMVCTAPGTFGGIDGGLDFYNGVLLYTTYSDNQMGQVKPGSTQPDRLINLADHGITGSVGTLRVVPPGFPGAGRLKIVSYSGNDWHDATMQMAGDGTVDLSVNPNYVLLTGGPEGVIYVASGNPGFSQPSILLSRYVANDVVAYQVDANGDPIPETMRPFVANLAGAEGACIDPLTGDFLFSTWGGLQRLILVKGFTQAAPCPADLNHDGNVDGADLGNLLALWGPATPKTEADMNHDGIVDGGDLGMLLAAWGDCQ